MDGDGSYDHTAGHDRHEGDEEQRHLTVQRGGVAGPVEFVLTALQTLHLAQEMVEVSSAPDEPEQHQKSKGYADPQRETD